MSIEENKAVVDRYTKAFNAANITIFEGVFDPDVVDHNPSPHQPQGWTA
jgi:hypothetical protein